MKTMKEIDMDMRLMRVGDYMTFHTSTGKRFLITRLTNRPGE